MKKAFKILVSRKFPNDCIGSIEFYTELDQQRIDDYNAAETAEQLAKRVYDQTINDLITCTEHDDIVKYIYEGVKKGAAMVKVMSQSSSDTE